MDPGDILSKHGDFLRGDGSLVGILIICWTVLLERNRFDCVGTFPVIWIFHDWNHRRQKRLLRLNKPEGFEGRKADRH